MKEIHTVGIGTIQRRVLCHLVVVPQLNWEDRKHLGQQKMQASAADGRHTVGVGTISELGVYLQEP